MPIYEYRCKSCGHELEKLQKMSDDPLTDCPQCDKPELNKLISAAGFRLSGSGWYETDFKSGNKKNLSEGKSEGKSGKSEGKKDAGASKTTPAAS
ncbi:MAG: FmdB family zinc ribbon protein [Pseudomonadales bacterium]|jgi:putative FmdB family regulatory protein|tara:strand:- start:831 stop:1115 length:285 start_codon:yes stop_codon:yes gene_type:complete